MPKPAQKVELHTAFQWTCEHCGQDNFERSVKFEPEMMTAHKHSKVDQRVIEKLEKAGINVGGEWVTSPKQVQCKHCGGQFGVEE